MSQDHEAMVVAYQDVVTDAENLIESLEALADACEKANVEGKWRGWAVPVEALRTEANRVAKSLAAQQKRR